MVLTGKLFKSSVNSSKNKTNKKSRAYHPIAPYGSVRHSPDIQKIIDEISKNLNPKVEEEKPITQKITYNSNYQFIPENNDGILKIPSLEMFTHHMVRKTTSNYSDSFNNKSFNLSSKYSLEVNFLDKTFNSTYWIDDKNNEVAILNSKEHIENIGTKKNFSLTQLYIFNNITKNHNGKYKLIKVSKINDLFFSSFIDKFSNLFIMTSFENFDLSKLINNHFDLIYEPLYLVRNLAAGEIDMGSLNARRFEQISQLNNVHSYFNKYLNKSMTCLLEKNIVIGEYLRSGSFILDACPLAIINDNLY
jgi:hypothetical protein